MQIFKRLFELLNKGGFEYHLNDSEPLLYYKTKENIEEYRKKPVELKLQWLQEQMEFFYYAMPEKAKMIRERLKNGKLGDKPKPFNTTIDMEI